MSMDMENMLQSVLGNPEAMEKIMAMAQSLGASQPPLQQEESGFEMPDMEMIQKMAALAGQSSIDPNQRALIAALRPYIGSHRLRRLERAMQAAKMAGLATGLMQKSI